VTLVVRKTLKSPLMEGRRTTRPVLSDAQKLVCPKSLANNLRVLRNHRGIWWTVKGERDGGSKLSL